MIDIKIKLSDTSVCLTVEARPKLKKGKDQQVIFKTDL